MGGAVNVFYMLQPITLGTARVQQTHHTHYSMSECRQSHHRQLTTDHRPSHVRPHTAGAQTVASKQEAASRLPYCNQHAVWCMGILTRGFTPTGLDKTPCSNSQHEHGQKLIDTPWCHRVRVALKAWRCWLAPDFCVQQMPGCPKPCIANAEPLFLFLSYGFEFTSVINCHIACRNWPPFPIRWRVYIESVGKPYCWKWAIFDCMRTPLFNTLNMAFSTCQIRSHEKRPHKGWICWKCILYILTTQIWSSFLTNKYIMVSLSVSIQMFQV